MIRKSGTSTKTTCQHVTATNRQPQIHILQTLNQYDCRLNKYSSTTPKVNRAPKTILFFYGNGHGHLLPARINFVPSLDK